MQEQPRTVPRTAETPLFIGIFEYLFFVFFVFLVVLTFK